MIARWLLAVLALAPGAAGAASTTQVHYVMGTYFRITAEGGGAERGATACFQEARRLDDVFSRWKVASELSRLNASAPGTHRVSPDMTRLLARSLALRAASGGTFDVALGPLTALWRRPDPPRAEEIEAARAAAGRDAVVVRDDRVTLARGARLDVDGIAKGWAVDACVERLRAAGVSRALVSLGESSLFALGAPSGESHWRLAVRGTDPDTTVGWLGLRDAAASVSATAGSPGGRPGGVSHIIDPRSGRPLVEDAVAVVVAPAATDAEAWTKALLVWGRPGVSRVRAHGPAAAIHVGRGGIGADVAGDTVTWAALPAPRVLAAAEEPLR